MEISNKSDGGDLLVETKTLTAASLPSSEPTATNNEQQLGKTELRCSFSSTKDVTKLQQDLDDCISIVVRQNTAAMQKDEEIQVMRAQLESSQLALKDLTGQMENMTRIVGSLSLRLDQLSSTIRTNKDVTSTELKSVITSSIGGCENSISILKETITADRGRNDNNIQTLRTTVDGNSNKIESSQRQLENMDAELRSVKTTIQENHAAILSKISPTAPLHRYWNRILEDHFYTTNWNELGGGKGDYVYEGVQGYVHTSPTN